MTTLYVDSSAFVKRHVPSEVHHEECLEIMESSPDWATSRLTLIEATRSLALRSGADPSLIAALDEDTAETAMVDIDLGVIAHARAIALETGVTSLDAIHIASAHQFPTDELEFLTYDDRQADAARGLGLRLAR